MQEASSREMSHMGQRTAELKAYEQQYKKKQRTELCDQLMDKIFDIADEAYNHMQDLDSKEWDSRNWNNWLKLFVHKQNVAGTMGELLHQGEDDDTCCDTDAQKQLDESELHDYIKNEGQWPATIVSENKISLADVLNPKVEAAAPAKGAKPAGKAPAQSEVVMDEADLEVADTAANNFIFGDVIDQLIKLHYPSRPDLKHPPTPNWLALKLCLVGYPFSGKKTQAAMIKEKYGLDVFIMEDLVNEAMEFNPDEKRLNSPNAPMVDLGSYDYAGLSEDEVLEYNVTDEFAKIGQEIKEQLLNGEEISDALYVRLFICKLRCTYTYKCPITKRREVELKAHRFVEINKRIGEIETEKQKEDLPKKHRKALIDEETALNQELAEMEDLPTDGWVLVDFPSSYAQAKLLEEALSGYRPQEELEATDREKETKDALLLVQPHAESDMAKTLNHSGLDAVIWLDMPPKEALRRSDGRRYDS
jgi:adenylate kinase family enzyme